MHCLRGPQPSPLTRRGRRGKVQVASKYELMDGSVTGFAWRHYMLWDASCFMKSLGFVKGALILKTLSGSIKWALITLYEALRIFWGALQRLWVWVYVKGAFKHYEDASRELLGKLWGFEKGALKTISTYKWVFNKDCIPKKQLK